MTELSAFEASAAKTRSALVLVRTPLQAWIVQQVLIAESVSNYDLLYFTQHDVAEDHHYFRKLADRADHAEYCYAPVRPFDILGHMDFRRQTEAWYWDRGFDRVLLSSIDSFVPNAIANRQRSADLVTFDDGTGNFNRDSIYHVGQLNWRGRMYRRLLGAADLESTRARIVRHYTIFPQFGNIVEAERLCALRAWTKCSPVSTSEAARTYFIGAPFEEALRADQIRLLEDFLKEQNVDWYVRHPRERRPLKIGAPFLAKGGRIAEDAILADAAECRPHVIGWFSTVLFNLGEFTQRRTMILLKDDPRSEHMAQLGETAGCETVFL